MVPFSDPQHTSESVSFRRIGIWAQLEEISSSLRWVDILVFVLILGFGVFQFLSVERARDFLNDDVFYSDSGRSLVEHGFYGINGYAETNQPPGLPAILGLLCAAGACGHIVSLRVMVVFGTLGFLASYELLRRQLPRGVAAVICLLLISSPSYFKLVTQWVCSAPPYLFTATSALLVAGRFEKARRSYSRFGLGALLAALIAASLAFATAGIALLGAIVARIFVVSFRDRRLAFNLLRTYLPVLLIGIAVQGLWMHKHEPVDASSGIAATEWPVPGFPQSYVSQLKVKRGNYPELGMATLRDIPARILKNASEHASFLSQMLLRRSLFVTSISVVVLGSLIVIGSGWLYSVWSTGGGLLDWYFAGYESVYLLWPWDQEPRFMLPVAPLACLYLWRGAESLFRLARCRPRLVGAVWLPVGVVVTAAAWCWMRGLGMFSHLAHAGLQDEFSVAGWLLSTIIAGWMVWADTAWLNPAYAFWRWYSKLTGMLQLSPPAILKFFGVVAASAIIFAGFAKQFDIGRANLDPSSGTNRLLPDGTAGEWIRSNTDTSAVIMARLVPTMFHYSQRKVVWFPPSSNPQLLMEGILKHKVNFVVVVRRKENYYLPPDDDSFAPLLAVYPDAFHLVYEIPEFRIFKVVEKVPPLSVVH